MKKTKSCENATILICPICGKEFKETEDTMYIAKGGFTCSWKCFLKYDQECAKMRKEKKKKK